MPLRFAVERKLNHFSGESVKYQSTGNRIFFRRLHSVDLVQCGETTVVIPITAVSKALFSHAGSAKRHVAFQTGNRPPDGTF